MKEEIRAIVQNCGADVCGIASIERFKDAPAGFSPTDIYKDCKSVIAFGVALSKGLYEINPRLLYSHFNGEVLTSWIDIIALRASEKIEEKFGVMAVPVPCDSPVDYWEEETLTAKGMISMKHTAVQCGLGQLGKSTLLVNPKYGNRLTIGAILLNVEMESDPISENICLPGCHLCEEKCPVQAIQNGSVQQKKCRPNTYGVSEGGYPIVNCNVCRNICPMKFGKKN